MVQMALNSSDAHAKMSSDRSVRHPFAHKSNDLSLAWCEMDGSGNVLRMTYELPTLRHGWIEDCISMTRGSDRIDQLLSRHRFEQISNNSRFQCTAHRGVIVVRREDYHPGPTVVDSEFTGDVYPVSIRKPDIEKSDVRVNFASESDSVVSSTCLGHHDDVLSGLQYLPCSDALNLMIVNNQHP